MCSKTETEQFVDCLALASIFVTWHSTRLLACSVLRSPQRYPLFHALTGYDTVSSFSSRGKNMDRLSSCNITHSLLQLSLDPNSVSQPQVFSVIERFVVLMYDRTSDTDYVNISESSCSLAMVGQWRQFLLHVTPLCNTLNELAIKLCQFGIEHFQAALLFPPQMSGVGKL